MEILCICQVVDEEVEEGVAWGVAVTSPTVMFFEQVLAGVALDFAAPAEVAVAAFLDEARRRFEAATATQQLAAFDRPTAALALPPARSQRPLARVEFAEVGRVFDVDEVAVAGALVAVASRCELMTRLLLVEAHHHLARSVEVLLQDGADLAEVRHLLPAGAHLATATDAMTLALSPHVLENHLQTIEKQSVTSRVQVDWMSDSGRDRRGHVTPL